ncbi:hypothetical protein AJ80_01480 [Polytolypa hystricis UAMH7299]|uniref:Uncharacterized protein n=1 Tax=Polytolypa hystricis (strain UAMH7299) TaxID=1447883 RepID=A0A2B7Z230_POLH7|nr:hypothetical protein AJ80_01480 [Polytolypa hystricis UAMH7299]
MSRQENSQPQSNSLDKMADPEVDMAQLLYDVFDRVAADSKAPGLDGSKWAPSSGIRKPATTPKPTLKPQPAHTNPNMAHVEDTAAFMAAFRNRINKNSQTPATTTTAPAASAEKQDDPQASNNTETHPVSESKPIQPTAVKSPVSENEKPIRQYGATPQKPAVGDVVEEDREHLTRFASWGTPAPRDTPPARIRRVLLSNIPNFLNTPAKVQSIIFGGAIDSFSISTSSATGISAQVVFCDADACKKFYDQTPNGLDVEHNGRRGTVFVDLGGDVDVVSSQLKVSLNVGATRVLRAVGVNTGLSMKEMHALAEGKNFKLEKILDSYDAADKCRTVTFRFCSIDDAVRFRGVILRHEDWEQCNIQYATDP